MGPSDKTLSINVHQQTPIPIHAEFRVTSNQILALVGPSGSGKSTLLRIISGLSQPEGGQVQSGNEVWYDRSSGVCLKPQQRRVGYVPQHLGLFPHMNTWQNISAGIRSGTPSQKKERAYQWLRKMRLNGLEHRLPRQLSGGQQQRVALARALGGEPRVLLLDETFSSVDADLKESLYQELLELKEELLIPVILVTHDLDEALSLADEMALMDQGTLLQWGKPEFLFSHPKSVKVARLMGHQNLYSGVVLEASDSSGKIKIDVSGLVLSLVSPRRWSLGQSIPLVIPESALSLEPPALVQTQAQVSERINVSWELSSVLKLNREWRLGLKMPGTEFEARIHVSSRPAPSAFNSLGSRLEGFLDTRKIIVSLEE